MTTEKSPEELEQWHKFFINHCNEDNFIKLVEALTFYADPETYFAVSVFGDPPCGAFASDIGTLEYLDDHGNVVDTEHRPGEYARTVLADVLNISRT